MSLLKTARNTVSAFVIAAQLAAFPAISFAQEAASDTTSGSTSSTTAPAAGDATTPRGPQGDTGTTSPTGADSSTYTKNEDGSWSNGQYTWNPATKQTSPNKPSDYSYNPATGKWDTTEYVYSPETGKYVPNVKSSVTNPNAASVAGSGAAATASPAGGSATINGTGPNSNNTIGGTTNTNSQFDLFFNGAISNTIGSNATSGNAGVQGNTKAGSALTGDAAAIANVLNMLQSSWLGQSSDVATFMQNIDGSVYGDLLIDPSALAYNLGTTNSNVDVNLSNNGAINNDINLAAKSGDANVSSNTEAGNATTGNARAMANVINMINSAITSGKSFMGMVNINGTLDGDILLPAGVLENLIANTGPNSNNTIGSAGTTNNNLAVTNDTARTINNNVTTAATSGAAINSGNTASGNATSGTADSSVNTMNVVGQNVKGKNGMLVFVNVLGKWMGMVVNPNGTIANTGPNSNNVIGNGTSSNNVSVDSKENSLINNKINVTAESGDATVTNNTKAGDATTGNAQASVNLLNVIGSDIDVSDWFGVLFINVFGNWTGNFGDDTAAGGCSQNCPATPTGGTTGGATQNTATTNSNPVSQVFSFIAGNNRVNNQTAVGTDQGQPATDDQANTNQAVLADTAANGGNGAGAGAGSTNVAGTQFNWWIVAGTTLILVTLIVIGREYLMAVREERLA